MSLADVFRPRLRFPTLADSVAVPPYLQLAAPKWVLADEGSYFVATNPGPGTPIAFAVNAAVSETAGYFLSVQNTDAAQKLYLDYLRLICAAVPASATSGEMFVKTDTVGFASGGTPITPVSVNGEIPVTTKSSAVINAGALTTNTRSANARLLARSKLRTAIPVAGDEWIYDFGCQEFAGAGITGGATALRMPIGVPPVIVAPGSFALFQLWFPANAVTPASFEFELGYWMR